VSASIAEQVASAARGRSGGARAAARETPLGRLARLRAEAAALDADVTEMEARLAAGAASAGSPAAAGPGALELAKEGLGQLQGVMEGLAGRVEALAAGASGRGDGAGDELTAALAAAGGTEAAASADAAAISGADGAGAAHPGGDRAVPGLDDAAMGALEMRVAELEASVGSGQGDAGTPGGLLARLERAEEAAAALTPAGVELIGARAASALETLRALRAEAADARGSQDPTADIVGLRDAMARLETVEAAAEAIPLVVSRLEALAGLHARAGEAVRLAEELSSAAAAAQTGKDQAREAVEAVRSALAEAGKAWAKTAADIDARLADMAVS